jgi:hypothetical protein
MDAEERRRLTNYYGDLLEHLRFHSVEAEQPITAEFPAQ